MVLLRRSTTHHVLFFLFATLIRCSDAFTLPHSATPIASTTRSYGVSTILQVSSSDEGDDESVDEIFYDDFAGPIGDVVSTSSSSSDDLSSSLSSAALQTNQNEEEEDLPEFNDSTSEQQNESQKEGELISIPLPKSSEPIIDLTGSLVREFSLGRDLLLSDYAGSLGFDQVTDWQYYTTDLVTGQRENRAVNSFDPNQPSRTRSKSGSVVRIFRGEFTGRLGGILRSKGLDTRVLLKEFAVENDDDEMLVNLARDEQRSLAKLQSNWLQGYCMTATNNNAQQKIMLEQLENGEWNDVAQRRYVDGLTDTPTTNDDDHLVTMLECTSLKKAPFTSILGQLNLNDYYDDEDMNPNEWYKSLGVVSDEVEK